MTTHLWKGVYQPSHLVAAGEARRSAKRHHPLPFGGARARTYGFRSRVSGITLTMDTEVKRLEALLEACHDVLSALGDREDEIAEAIRETCRVVEARLRELDVGFASRFAHPS